MSSSTLATLFSSSFEQLIKTEEINTEDIILYIIDGCFAVVFLLCALFFILLFITKRSKTFLLDISVPILSMIMLFFCLVKTVHTISPIFELIDNYIASFTIKIIRYITLYGITLLIFGILLLNLYFIFKQFTVNGNVLSLKGVKYFRIFLKIIFTLQSIFLFLTFGLRISELVIDVFYKEKEPDLLKEVSFYIFIGSYSYQMLLQILTVLFGILYYFKNISSIPVDDHISKKSIRLLFISFIIVFVLSFLFMSTTLTPYILEYFNTITKENLSFFYLAGDVCFILMAVCCIIIWGPLNPVLKSSYVINERRPLMNDF
ncbi:hypothetical protein ABK040_014062 [Willaertia magna]